MLVKRTAQFTPRRHASHPFNACMYHLVDKILAELAFNVPQHRVEMIECLPRVFFGIPHAVAQVVPDRPPNRVDARRALLHHE